MIVGNYQDPTTAVEAVENLVVVTAEETLAQDGRVVKLSALLDGLGSASGVQRLRGAVWDLSGLVAVTEEIEIANGDPEGWYDLPFAEALDWPADEKWRLGLHFGAPTKVARWHHRGDSAGLSRTDTYSDGTAALTGTSAGPQPMLFATYATESRLPHENDLYYANLGFQSAQAKLGETEATGGHHRMRAGWHGTFLDTESQGASLAIVDSGSPLLDDLVGERLRINHQNRSVVVYVHRATELDSGDIDLSLSRRAFAALTLLSVEELPVRVEVLT